MNRKFWALTIASTLVLNSFQMALAQTAANDSMTTLNEQQIQQLLKLAQNKTTDELVNTLEQVKGLMQKLETMQSSTESDPVLKYANQMQIVLIAMSGILMNSHLKNDEVKKATLAISTATLILNKIITNYKEKHRLDSKTISETIFITSRGLAKSGILTPELEKVTSSLDSISAKLIDNQSQIESIITNLGGTQDVALIASVGYLLLHIVYPKIAKETDGYLKNILPKIREGAEKLADATKKPVAYGTVSALGIPDILSMTAGISSEQSKKIIQETLINLNTIANKLSVEIGQRKVQSKS